MVEFTWKANYIDGTNVQLAEGATYPSIDREDIESFDIMDGNNVVYHLKIKSGDNFFYRRRVSKTLIGNKITGETFWYLLGIVGKEYLVVNQDKSVIMKHDDPRIELFDYEVPCRNGN